MHHAISPLVTGDEDVVETTKRLKNCQEERRKGEDE